MKKFITIDDIERKKSGRAREEFKRRVSGDIKGMFDDILKPIKPPKKEKKKKNWFLKTLKWIGMLLLVLFVINFILFLIWAFKTLIKSLFGI